MSSHTKQASRNANAGRKSRPGERTNPLHWGDLSNVPPETPFRRFLWKQRVWFESTVVLSLMEPWEKVMLLCIYLLISILLLTSIFLYLPHHLNFLQKRARFYFFGDEKAVWESAAAVVASHLPGDEL